MKIVDDCRLLILTEDFQNFQKLSQGRFIISDHFLGLSAVVCKRREYVYRKDAKLF